MLRFPPVQLQLGSEPRLLCGGGDRALGDMAAPVALGRLQGVAAQLGRSQSKKRRVCLRDGFAAHFLSDPKCHLWDFTFCFSLSRAQLRNASAWGPVLLSVGNDVL